MIMIRIFVNTILCPYSEPESRSERRLHFHPRAAARRASNDQRCGDTLGPFAHSQQAEARVIAVGDEAFAVVFHRKVDRRSRPLEANADSVRVGMTDRIGNRLLSDTEERVF